MLLASSGWCEGCHFCMVRDDSTSEVELQITTPFGKTEQRTVGSIEAANRLVDKQVRFFRILKDEIN